MNHIPPSQRSRIYLNDPNISDCKLDINFNEDRVKEFNGKKAKYIPQRKRPNNGKEDEKVEENINEEKLEQELEVQTTTIIESECKTIDLNEKRDILEGKLMELNELLESIEENDNQNIMFHETITAKDAGVDIGLLRIRKAALLNSLGRYDEAYMYLDKSMDLINLIGLTSSFPAA